ncbi:MAG: polysaccharide pyruvyl transferase family protein [Akkermansia sp.]|nr:polysaccharide pyruvyl transferase family protein [Akkermansia sp.]
MKKIGILTFHRACNYGAVLQCYALNKTLEQLGGSPTTIDYFPSYFRTRYYPTLEPFSIWHIKSWLRHKEIVELKETRNRKFEQFAEKELNLHPGTAHNLQELQEIIQNSGIRTWICGSDQVWNNTCANFDQAFFLYMDLPSGSEKYSYAASFAFKELPQDLSAEYRKRLENFKKISVREQSGIDIIRKLQLGEAYEHCDPALLLTASDWNKIASKVQDDSYILIYHVKKADLLLKKATELKKKTGLKIVYLSSNYYSYSTIYGKQFRKYRYTPVMESSPQDFISLFANAKYVITNSFHGTVFSILFHKNFWSQLHLTDGKVNERVKNLLDKVGITNRWIVDESTPLQENAIDWESVDRRVDSMRTQAKSYLSDIIQETFNN